MCMTKTRSWEALRAVVADRSTASDRWSTLDFSLLRTLATVAAERSRLDDRSGQLHITFPLRPSIVQLWETDEDMAVAFVASLYSLVAERWARVQRADFLGSLAREHLGGWSQLGEFVSRASIRLPRYTLQPSAASSSQWEVGE